ncbi:MAG: hypothetical protein ACRDP4_05665 [Nocardioidaceae bacterium]
MIDKSQAEHLAALIHAIREDWGLSGIMAALVKVRERPLADVTLAAMLAASVASNRTPEIIAMGGDHWRDVRHATTSEASRHTSSVPWAQLCDHCNRSEPHCQDPTVQAEDPHEFTTAALRRARAAKAKPAVETDPNAKPYVNPELRAGIRADIGTGKAALASAEAEHVERRPKRRTR